MIEEESSKKVVLPENKEDEPIVVGGDILIVKTWDRMLELLDEDYEVIEELSSETFLMSKIANQISNKITRKP